MALDANGSAHGTANRTILHYLQVLKDLYRQRAKLVDAPNNDPLPTESPVEAAGVTPPNKGWIPFIPDAVAVDLLSKALDWITHHPEPVLAARETWHAAFAASKASGQVRPRARAWIALKLKDLKGPKGEAIDDARVMRRLVVHLTDACFIVIAGFVGMRVSEILSMEAGCIEMRPLGESGVAQAYIVARMFKTVDDPTRAHRALAGAGAGRACGRNPRAPKPPAAPGLRTA
jgi:hypothetical protein